MASEERSLSQGAQGATVAQIHTLLRTLQFTLDPAEVQTQTFARSTHDAVQTFQRMQGLAITGVVDAPTLAAMQRAEVAARTQLKADIPTRNVPAQTIAVQGIVTLADGSAMAAAPVALMAQNLRGMRALAQTTTDDAGDFALILNRPQLRGSGKLDDGLVAQVLNAQGQVIAQSDAQFRLGDTATFRLVIAAQVITPPSEFARVQAAAGATLADGMALGSLTKPQIQFVARQIGMPVRQVDALKHAQDHAARWQLPAPLLYACARQGLSAQVERLVGFDDSAVRVAVRHAVEEGQIAPIPPNELDAAFKQLAQARITVQLTAKTDAQSASLGDLLGLVQIPVALHPIVATHAAAYGLVRPPSGRRYLKKSN
jgi:hypothetical protein